MRLTSILSLALLGCGCAAAETSSVDFLLFGLYTHGVEASVIGSDSTATTYHLQCLHGSSDCGFLPPGGFDIVEGPSTVAYSMKVPNGGAAEIRCHLYGTTSAVCTESANDPSLTASGLYTTHLTGEQLASAYVPVVVVGAASAATTGATPTAPTAMPTASPISASVTAASSASAGSKTSLVSGATQTLTSTSSSQARAPKVTNRAQWAAGGAAMALALAAM